MSEPIFPMILCGEAGSRLWPLWRESLPKPLLAVAGDRTMLQEAALRVADPARFRRLTVIGGVDHRFLIAEQLLQAGALSPRIVLEPGGAGTALAVAVAALVAQREDPAALILILPADHVIAGEDEFLRALDEALPAARDGALVAFGVPDSRSQGGDYLNTGIFLVAAAMVIAEYEALAPEVMSAARAALDAAACDLDFIRLDARALSACPAVSFDQAIVERTRRVAVTPARFTWSEAESWSDLWRIASQDGKNNVEIGDVLASDTRRSYLRSEGPLIAAVGVKDVVVIATPDAVLVARRGTDEAVEAVVERLKVSSHSSAVRPRRVHRPWGWFESLQTGERFQVKRITVRPGGQLSLQKHFHRAEHWVVVNGCAEVRVGDETRRVGENQAVHVPLGAVHRLSNPGPAPLHLIEVQCGGYLGEDDIVRLADVYARPVMGHGDRQLA